jgi:hypothetical protein
VSIKPATSTEIQAIESRLGAKGRRVFSVAGWNESLRKAANAAGLWWLSNYGVLRWNRAYAQGKLGYAPRSAAKRIRMIRGESPFFSSGDFQTGFNTKSKVVAKATKGHARFWITIPGGHLNYHPTHLEAFRRVPPGEAVAIAREFRRALIQQVQTGRVQHAAKVQARAAAKIASKQATIARRAEARRARRNQATRSAV